MPKDERQAAATLLAITLMLVAFSVTLRQLDHDSLWNDEAWSMWAVYSPSLDGNGLSRVTGLRTGVALAEDAARAAWSTLAKVRDDVHPPLYFLLLLPWTWLTGESAFAARMLSLLFGMVALSATYATGKRLYQSQRVGLYALALLGSAGFFVYYSREARMYTLLLALAALAMWAYLLWLDNPTRRRTVIYALLLTAALYTHYAAMLLVVTQVVHLLLLQTNAGQRDPSPRRVIPFVAAAVLFAPWLLVMRHQFFVNGGQPLALPVPTNGASIIGLALVMTAGYGWLLLLPYLFGRGVLLLVKNGRSTLLVALWLLLTPAVLFLVNTQTPLYQVRYVAAIVPAVALVVAVGIRGVYTNLLALIFAGALIYAQYDGYSDYWHEKPRWQEAVTAMVEARHSLEPAITDLAPNSPAGYYNRVLDARRGISLDLSWRRHTYTEMTRYVAAMQNPESVWLAMPTNVAKTWYAAAMLDAERGVGYRDGVVNVVFYRFDRGLGGADDLLFRFGNVLRYDGDLAASFHLSLGDELCFEVPLYTEVPLVDDFALSLQAIRGHNVLVAQADVPLAQMREGERFSVEPCITIPPDAVADEYALHVVVYERETGARLPVIESGLVGWGDALVVGAARAAE